MFAVLAMVISVMAIATPAQAALADTSATCPDSIPSAGYTDLGGLDAATVQAIDCVTFYSISKGVGTGLFAPNDSTPRWQMALFLTRTADVMGIALPSGADQGFLDIGTYDAETQKAINQIAQLDVSKGTSATTYDPAGIVSRWQMALFLTRLLDAGGITLPDGAAQGFLDIGTKDAETQKAINQTVQLGVSNGTSATAFSPDSDSLRWHMALFLTRTGAVAGVVPAGLGAFITDVNTAGDGGYYKYADTNACAEVKVTYKKTDSFTVNGSPATYAAFESNLNLWGGPDNNQQIQRVGTTNILDTKVEVTSGVISWHDFDDDFDIWEPVAGDTLADYDINNEDHQFWMVDGASSSDIAFGADMSVGDTVVVTGGDGTTAAKAQTFALTNGTASGDVADAGAIEIDTGCQVLDVGTPAGTDSITVDGKTETLATFNAEISTDDTLTYSYKGDKGTWVLTNGAPALKTGEAAANVGGTTFDVYRSGTSTVPLDWTTDNDGGAWDTLKVNGSVATEANFAAALTAGDVVKYRFADTDTSTKSSLEVVDAAYSGAPATYGDPNITLYSFGTSGNELDSVDITDLNPLGFTSNTAVKYTVNGSSATKANFEANVAAAISNKNGTVTLSDSGTDTVWALTTP